MKQTTLVAIVLGILVLITMVQAFQLNGMKDNIKEGKASVSSAGNSAPASSGGSPKAASVPSNIKDLPQMVGGC